MLIINFWGVSCSVFGFLFILSRVDLTQKETQIYFLSWVFATIIIATTASLFYGGFRILFGINIEHKDALVINNFVLNDRVDSKISDDNLKKLFHQLKKEGKTSFRNLTIYASLVAIMSIIPMILIETSVNNLIIILIGDVIAIIMVALFVRFSSERFSAVFLRECREIMRIRGIKYDENIQLFTLKSAFYYFILLFVLMIIIVFSFIPNPTPFLFVLICTGFLFIILMVKMLFFSIFDIFKEVESFVSKISREEKIEYFTASSYKEAIKLSENLTISASKVYEARETEKKAYETEKKARLKLEDLDKVKDEFITTAAHQLRTPLSATRWALKSSIDGTFQGEEQKQILQKAYETNNNLIN
ncbi:MAG: hypothetical protein KAI72_09280, partial [Candidatus Pacebacteria bacterium]|nr:hypothetical protein [Candidatus Paceibacterota bacterium]